MKLKTAVISLMTASLALGAASQAHAQQAASGRPAPWALIGNDATSSESGPWSQASWARGIRAEGLPPSFWDRVELSIARPNPGLPSAAFYGVGPASVLGLQLRVAGIAGDGAPGSNSWMPQIAVGMQHKSFYQGFYQGWAAGPALHLQAGRTTSTDFYVSATKLLQAQGVLLNATVRAARPATLGQGSYSLRPELSLAFLLSRNLAVGAEYRFKPGNYDAGRGMGLGDGLRDDDAKNLYIAWAPYKNLSLTLAYVGQDRAMPGITMDRRPSRGYLSAELSF